MKHKILVVDDQRFSKLLLSGFVEDNENLELLTAVSSGEEAVEFCKSNAVDLVIMDVVLGHGMTGLEAAKFIKESKPEIKILIITSMPEVSYIARAKEIGVESFWYKEVQSAPIIEVVTRTLAGESIYPDSSPVVKIGNAQSSDLTKTELTVLRKMTTGATNRDIAKSLNIEETTVKKHITSMLQKTGFHNRVELAVNARITGLVIED